MEKLTVQEMEMILFSLVSRMAEIRRFMKLYFDEPETFDKYEREQCEIYALYRKVTNMQCELVRDKLDKEMLKKVYKRNGRNCVDMNDTYTYLPDDLTKVNAICIDGEYYIKPVIVNISI